MAPDWTGGLPTMIYFILGVGGVAAALLAMVKFWETIVPDRGQHMVKDIAIIKSDIQDIRTRVGMLELDVAKIDQPSIAKRFDTLEGKIDKLYDFLLERLTKLPS